jgi:hypothetical protein
MDKLDDPKQRKITEFFEKKEKIVKGYNDKTQSWHCLDCGIDMGPTNSRQLCEKYYCITNFYTYPHSPWFVKPQ